MHDGAFGARLVAGEISLVVVDEFLRGLKRGAFECVELAYLRRRHDQWPGLAADHMIGRDDAGASIARHILAVDEIQNRIAGAEFQDRALVRAFAAGIEQRAGAAQDRRDLDRGRDLLRQFRTHEQGFAVFLETIFRQRDERDHALVGLARVGAEGEDAVLVEDQPFHLRILFEHLGGFFGEPEAWHDVRHEAEPAAEHLNAQRGRVRLVDQAEHRGGVGVIDVFRRHECVQQHLDRRRGRLRIDQIGARHSRHLVVGKLFARAQGAQRLDPHGGEAGGLDRTHVGAGALDAQHRDLLAGEVARFGLQRAVAAAMQHQSGVAAEQASGINPQC